MTFYPYAFHTTPYKIQKEFSFATRKLLFTFIHNYKISYYESYPFGFIVCQRHVSAHISFIFLLHANLVPSLLFQGQHSIPEYHPAFVQRLRKESSYLLLFQKHATFPIQSILGRFLSYKFANHMVSQIFQCSNVTFC